LVSFITMVFKPVAALVLLALLHKPEAKRVRKEGALNIPSFASFISTRERTYVLGSAEYEERRALYEQRIEEAVQHNSQIDRRWKAGISNLWDRTEVELSGLRGWNGGASSHDTDEGAAAHTPVYLSQDRNQAGPHASGDHRGNALPHKVSWAHLDSIKENLDQGGCGSCWAVASAVVLSAHREIYSPETPHRSFSVQELVSCVPNPKQCGGEGGCQGATVELAFEYAMSHGLADDHDVPYHASDRPCKAKASLASVNLTQSPSLRQTRGAAQPGANMDNSGGLAFGMHGWATLPKNKYEPLMTAVAEKGPVGVSVAANGWMLYTSGIYDSCGLIVNHAVTLIGYGEAEQGKYWLIKNSWGADWGEEGKMRLLRTDDDENQCGLDNQAEKGTACKDDPKEVTVCGTCGILYDSAVPHFEGDGAKAKKQALIFES